jgi:hypothetical protein
VCSVLALSLISSACSLEASPGDPTPRGGSAGSGGTGGKAGSDGEGGKGGRPSPTASDRPCSDDNDCLGDFPLCLSGLCNTCSLVDSSGCGGEKPICFLPSSDALPVCAECERNTDCAFGSCVEGGCVTSCGNDDDCPTLQPVCGPAAQCVECTTSRACPTASDQCSPAGECVECLTDADCGPTAPSCTEGSCACTLDVNQLATDRNHCGGCGQACLGNDICAAGTCTEPSNSRFTSVSGGSVMKSSAYTLHLSSGQAPGGNAVLSSSRFTLKSGFPGTTGQ